MQAATQASDAGRGPELAHSPAALRLVCGRGPDVGAKDRVPTAVHVPDLDTLLPGDVIYNGIHPWMYRSDHARRMDWIETVNEGGQVFGSRPSLHVVVGRLYTVVRDEQAGR